MNEHVATNIRTQRETLSWTQEQLAVASNLSTRTVQRAEEGAEISAETLMAIAGALDTTVDLLRCNPHKELAKILGVPPENATPELLEAKLAEEHAKYVVVPLKVVESSSDLVCDADGMHFDCMTADDDVQDLAAELQQQLTDLIDLWSDLEPVQRRQYVRETHRVVEQLGQFKCRVSVGVRRHALRLGSGSPMPFATLYVIIAPEAEVKKWLMVPTEHAVRFQ